MPAATTTSLPGPATFAKMEDRKRPAVSAVDELAPPSKRQAVNGGSKSKDDSGDAREEAWIEEYQKGAIYRQMLEYKREKGNLETRIHDLEGFTTHHDDHLRIIDAWLLQLLQEIELLVEGVVSSSSLIPDSPSTSSLSLKGSEEFQRHFEGKAKILKNKVESLVNRLAACRGEVKTDASQLESQIKNLLAQQKEYLVKLDRLEIKNATLSEQLDKATLKSLKAERKLDRAKSAQVQKLEQQALAVATARPAVSSEENGGTPESNDDYEELKIKHTEAIAVIERQKAQIELLLAEVKGLRDENATFKIKKEAISDEDYARTEIFKQFKSQNEELIRRINNLEATNKQLREEAEKLQAERTSFKIQLESEAQAATSDLEEQVQRLEADLTRIRSARDDLYAEREARKANEEQERTALAHLRELIEVKDDRISAMESELARLRPSEDATMTTPREDLDSIPVEELKEKYLKLERDFEAINKEMPLLEKSYKKSASMANKKVMDFAALEEKVVNLSAEKTKTDQKYFASKRESDTTKNEVRNLRIQTAKSSEIVAQLKAVEVQNKSLIQNLEKQAADLRQSNLTAVAERKKFELSSVEATRRADSTKAQISDLTNLVKSKDAAYLAVKEESLAHERELDKMKARVAAITADRDSWKSKKLSNSSEDEEMLRKLVVCSVCRTNFKNTVLKGCGHVFCFECVDNRLTNRMRKCPSCNKSFDRSEAMQVHL